jgi:hypothetical protein
VTINGDLTVTGKTILSGSSISDSTIKALNKRIDSLVAAISTKTYGKIDSSTLFSANPVFVNKFLDSTFLPSINFDGSKTYVNIGSANLASTIANSNITFEFWVKNILKNSTSQTVFSTGYEMQGQGINVSLNAGRLTFSFNNSNHQIGIDYPNDSLWHHVAFTNKEKSNSTIYLDGVEKMRSNNIGLNVYSSQRLSIGATINGTSPSDFYKGSIRKMRINKGISYASNFTPSYTYTKADSTIAFWELNDLGTRIKASDSAYNGTLYNGTWLVPDTTSTNLKNGLVAYYPFNGNLNDSSGYGNNLTNSNAILTTDRNGIADQAYYFNATKNAYAVSTKIPITLTGSYTFSYWQNLKGFNQGNAILEVIRNSSTIANLNPLIWQYNNKVYLTTSTNSNNQMLMDTMSNLLNKWVNFTWTVSAGVTNIYKNGSLIASSTSMPWPSDATVALTLANNANTNSPINSAPSDVILDDIRIYNRVLSLNEIIELSKR